MRMRSAAVVIVVSTITCQPDTEMLGGPGVQERDSAGIRIVENPRRQDGSWLGWRIGPEPTASIGVLEGDDPYMLFAVRDATVLYDGRIIVVGANELRVFDPAGIYLETWGGSGEGPGEFTDLHQADPWLGDSIVAGDLRHETITVFDPDGNPGRIIRLEDSPIVSLRAIFELGQGGCTGPHRSPWPPAACAGAGTCRCAHRCPGSPRAERNGGVPGT